MSKNKITQDFDLLHRYLFSEHQVRGELVQLNKSFSDIIDTGEYPTIVGTLLGELMCAAALLTAMLKFEGEISIQLQGDGAIRYIAINGTHEQALRGTARWDGELCSNQLSDLFPNGLIVITITPTKGERYQGVVALEHDSLAACLESYFSKSEQLDTKIILHCDMESRRAGGLLLQALPKIDNLAVGDFEHLSTLTASITQQELLNLPAHDVLYRLYHQEKVELFDPQPVNFVCGCSKQKSLAALRSVPKQELYDIIESEGAVTLNCQYCNEMYRFSKHDIDTM